MWACKRAMLIHMQSGATHPLEEVRKRNYNRLGLARGLLHGAAT